MRGEAKGNRRMGWTRSGYSHKRDRKLGEKREKENKRTEGEREKCGGVIEEDCGEVAVVEVVEVVEVVVE
jgi:hypothetical protein